jgi:4-amino-4-deoxy-L-arabinose transferase-like glycosyltransferase
MERISRRLLFFLVAGLVLYYLLSRLRIVVLVHVSLWQALVIVAAVIVMLFLALDHLINRDRGKDQSESRSEGEPN